MCITYNVIISDHIIVNAYIVYKYKLPAKLGIMERQSSCICETPDSRAR